MHAPSVTRTPGTRVRRTTGARIALAAGPWARGRDLRALCARAR
ncbi:MAG TPA: hypothetical protein VK875_00470 [Euzebyales bacterium]|nr:hypothetical protein [Euzebyales bacterium]